MINRNISKNDSEQNSAFTDDRYVIKYNYIRTFVYFKEFFKKKGKSFSDVENQTDNAVYPIQMLTDVNR